MNGISSLLRAMADAWDEREEALQAANDAIKPKPIAKSGARIKAVRDDESEERAPPDARSDESGPQISVEVHRANAIKVCRKFGLDV